MRAGELRDRVTIETRTQTSDGHDGYTETWTATAPRRMAAKVEPLTGRDLDHARQLDERAGHLVTLRYWVGYRDVAVGRARFVFHDGLEGDRYLEPVEPPREIAPRETLAVMCREAL